MSTSPSNYQYGKGYEPHTNCQLTPHIIQYAQDVQAKSILDIGCGNGTMTREFASVCAKVVGIDPSLSGIEQAKRVCPSATFYTLGVYEAPDSFAETDFDMAVSTEVIEHLFYPRALLKMAHAKLRPGGLLVLSTPYHGWLKNVAIAVLDKWDNHHTLFWDGGHIKFWSRATLSKLMEEEGFEVCGFQGCGRVPYLWASMILVGKKIAA